MRKPGPRHGGGGGRSSVRLAVWLVVVSVLAVTISSVRYLATVIANTHAAANHDASLVFEADKPSWKSTLGRTVSHIDHTLHSHHHYTEADARTSGISAEIEDAADERSAASKQQQQPAAQEAKPLVLEAKPRPMPKDEGGGGGGEPGEGNKGTCRSEILDRTEFWGDVVGEWGAQRKLDSPEECCMACQAYSPPTPEDPPCNVWVYCGRETECKHQYRECWLKHLAWTGASKPNTGDHIPWTSGTVEDGQRDSDQEVDIVQELNPEERAFHTVTTAQGSATHWQMRVHYYWFKKRKAECQAQGDCMMGGFTRLLHSGVKDDLMGEIPTVVVDPLPKDTPNHGYVVLNRPYAFVQWMKKSPPPEKYILMSEPDHVFLKPIPNLMKGDRPAAFPFFYIEPAKPEFKPITEKFLGKLTRQEAEKIAPIGSSPTFLKTEDLARLAPVWMNMSIAIFQDQEANKAWGWVLEMYGFTLALSKLNIGPVDVHLKMMAQPPWDTELDPYYILHFTYGMDYTKAGVFTPGKYGEWRFDKRSYSARPIPRHLEPPPPGCQNHLVRRLIEMFNEATDSIPGWDTYVKTYRP